MTKTTSREARLAMILASRLNNKPSLTADHLKLLERSLQLGALLEAIAKGHDPLLANDVMSHGKLRALIELAVRVREELDQAVIALCNQCDHMESTTKP